MTILGTLVESFAKTNKKLDNWTIKIFTCFSLRRNLVSLFNGGTSNDELRCLNGIRCLSMSWIIFGHTSLWTYHQAFSELGEQLGKTIKMLINILYLKATLFEWFK